MSCEDGVESRLVRAPERKRKGSKPWEVAWGPHDEAVYASLPDADWTILVQEVNRWVPEVAAMLDAFSFLPNVRVDDVMISYATPGGGVGPHIDSYDVFLIQGQGKRRWQIHTHEAKGRERALIPNIDLRVLERFEPDADEVFEAGDLVTNVQRVVIADQAQLFDLGLQFGNRLFEIEEIRVHKHPSGCGR